MSIQTYLSPACDIRSRLNRDYQRLTQLFDEAMVALRAGDREQAAGLWAQFDNGLRNHMDFEELHLVPQFRKQYPKAAAQLLAEHAQMFSLLNKLNTSLDVPALRAEMIDELIARLRAHADREDRLLYRWAQAHASELESYFSPAGPAATTARR